MDDNGKKLFGKMSSQELEERKEQILSGLPTIGHLIHGTLIPGFVKCGKPSCRCMRKGERHKCLRLSSYYHGHTGVDHVPASWEDWILEGIENYKSAQEMLLGLAEIYLVLFKRREKSLRKGESHCKDQ